MCISFHNTTLFGGLPLAPRKKNEVDDPTIHFTAGHGTYNNKTSSPRQVIGNQKLLVSVLPKPKAKKLSMCSDLFQKENHKSRHDFVFVRNPFSDLPTFIHPLLVWRRNPSNPQPATPPPCSHQFPLIGSLRPMTKAS